MQYAGLTLENPFVAAPMAGVSSPAFRLMARRGGASLVFSEMISAPGLVRGLARTQRMAQTLEQERPVGLQLFGGEPDVMYQAARLAGRLPVDLLDLNLGCPVRKVRRQGAGSALLEDPVRAAEVVAAAVEGGGRPVTVKLRLGRRRDQLEQILPGLLDAGIAGVCLHARTVAQGFGGRADWEAIKRLKSWCPVPLIGNGDVDSPRQAVAMLEQTGCDGVMIGRASRGNPWIFAQATALWQGRPLPRIGLDQRRRALWEHMELARRLGGEGPALHFARQFMMCYCRGLPDAAAFRRAAGAAGGLAELHRLAEGYFDRLEETLA